MASKSSSRRRFLTGGTTALAGLTVGAMRPAIAQMPSGSTPAGAKPASPAELREMRARDIIAYGERSRFVKSVRTPDGNPKGPFGMDMIHALTPLQDSMGTITPASLHFVASHSGMDLPDIDPKEHRLMIHGMVDRPLIFTMEELKRFPSVTRAHYVECNGNQPRPTYKTIQESHGKVSCSEWTGVLLSTLLEEAGVQKGATYVIAEAADGHRSNKSLVLAKAMKDTLVAYGQNGEPLRPQQGYPLRLLPPGFEGQANIKYLRRLEVANQPYVTYNEIGRMTAEHEQSPWLVSFEQGPKSVITFPSGGQQLAGRGTYDVTGLAWSGGGAIRRVEISTDGGRTWKDAKLDEPVQRMAFCRFHFTWNWNGEEAELQSRCTDDLDQVQPSREVWRKFWGFAEDNWSGAGVGHANIIQPWKVMRDGSVLNGLV